MLEAREALKNANVENQHFNFQQLTPGVLSQNKIDLNLIREEEHSEVDEQSTKHGASP